MDLFKKKFRKQTKQIIVKPLNQNDYQSEQIGENQNGLKTLPYVKRKK